MSEPKGAGADRTDERGTSAEGRRRSKGGWGGAQAIRGDPEASGQIESYPWPYRRIATEEAFCVPEVYEALRGWAAAADPAEPDQDFWDFVFTQDTPGLRRIRRQLLDLDGERLEIMDENGVDVQVLSLTAPGVQTFAAGEGTALARLANDRLAELIGKRPGRFAGLAAVAPQDPRRPRSTGP
jgi:predicted TIM-barrel fold metal-dependent hydrolase